MGFLRDMYREAQEKPHFTIEYDKEKRIYFPEGDLISNDGMMFGTRKYLKIQIINSGGIARNCKAKLRVVNWEVSTRVPSEEPKSLIWCDSSDNMSSLKDISAKNGSEFLNIVFSDSRFKSIEDNVFAFVSTKNALFPDKFYPAQDCFGIGDFEIEVIITSEDGSSANAQFRLHVDKDFRKLSMNKIS